MWLRLDCEIARGNDRTCADAGTSPHQKINLLQLHISATLQDEVWGSLRRAWRFWKVPEDDHVPQFYWSVHTPLSLPVKQLHRCYPSPSLHPQLCGRESNTRAEDDHQHPQTGRWDLHFLPHVLRTTVPAFRWWVELHKRFSCWMSEWMDVW